MCKLFGVIGAVLLLAVGFVGAAHAQIGRGGFSGHAAVGGAFGGPGRGGFGRGGGGFPGGFHRGFPGGFGGGHYWGHRGDGGLGWPGYGLDFYPGYSSGYSYYGYPEEPGGCDLVLVRHATRHHHVVWRRRYVCS